MSTDMAELSRQECLALLADGGVGRIAFCEATGPQIYPVSFVLHDGSIVFRTAAYSTLGAAARSGPVVFEVDDLDLDRRRGWSVVVHGTAEPVEDVDEIARLAHTDDPQPWAPGSRRLYVRISTHQVSGRRIE